MTIALIDADIVAYRVSAASEDTDENICVLRCDKQMRDILYSTNATEYKAFLSGKDNFRYKIYPAYKANRKDKPEPKWRQLCKEFLIKEWNAITVDGHEADDALGYSQTEETVICSIDKDLLQIPGSHFNWVKSEFYEQTWLGGIRHFYEQLLKGDRTDNIPGLPNIGDKKAAAFLEGCETEQEMYEVCQFKYQDDDLMHLYGKLLWIFKKENDIWQPPNFSTGDSDSKPEKEVLLDSIMQNLEEKNQSTEQFKYQKESGCPVHGLYPDDI